MSQQVPKVSNDDVERIVRRDFSAEQFNNVVCLLKNFGVEDWEKNTDVNRVRLAILKLANKNFDEIGRFLKIAKNDERDVISPAEYPRYDWDKQKGENFSADWQHQQYLAWLNAK